MFLLGWLPLAGATEWTLRAAIDAALADNLEIRQQALARDSAGDALREANATTWDPTLALSAEAAGARPAEGVGADGIAWGAQVAQPLPTGGTLSATWSGDRDFLGTPDAWTAAGATAGVTVEQPLLDGAGWTEARYAAHLAALGARDAELAWRDRAERLVADVANAYWGLVAARENARLARRSVEIAERQLAETRERFGEGFAGTGDVLQVERALGVARQTAVVAETAEIAAERSLARRVGLPQGGPVAIEPVDRPEPAAAEVDPDAAREFAARANTSLLRARLGVEEARATARHARNAALPDLGVAASVGWSAAVGPDAAAGATASLLSGADRAWAVAATLTTPLSPRGPLAEARQGRLALERAELEAEATWEDVQQALDAAVRAVARDRARVELAAATLAAAQAGLDADQELYREGRGSTRDVVRSLESLEEAQVARLEAEIDLQASLLELMRLQGTLLSTWGVE